MLLEMSDYRRSSRGIESKADISKILSDTMYKEFEIEEHVAVALRHLDCRVELVVEGGGVDRT